MANSSASPTVFDALLASLQKAADYNRDDTVPPAAVLWPDEKREWETLVPRLRAVLPQFLVFGPYDAAHRSGPAIWLRCVLAGKIAGITLPTGTVPIISRPNLRLRIPSWPLLRQHRRAGDSGRFGDR